MTERESAILGHTPMARYGAPSELTGAMIWLASDASGLVTGAEIASGDDTADQSCDDAADKDDKSGDDTANQRGDDATDEDDQSGDDAADEEDDDSVVAGAGDEDSANDSVGSLTDKIGHSGDSGDNSGADVGSIDSKAEAEGPISLERGAAASADSDDTISIEKGAAA